MLKYKKIISAILAVAMLGAMSTSVFAEDGTTEKSYKENLEILATPEIVESFGACGIDVSGDSIIEIASVESNEDTLGRYSNVSDTSGNAIVVTSSNGETATKEVIIMIGNDGIPETFEFNESEGTMTYGMGSGSFPPASWDGRYIIHGTAVYNERSNGGIPYYQPQKAYFRYSQSQACDVSYIGMSYICDGFEYTYPGFSSLGDSEISYVISVAESYPNTNTTYQTSDPYSSNRAIKTFSGSPFVGQFLTFNSVVDGTSYDYTVTI